MPVITHTRMRMQRRRESWMILLKVEPGLDSLRDEPRFDALVKRVGLI